MSVNKRILFITIPEKGHINPMIGIAQKLHERGFELAFFAQSDIGPQLRMAGLNIPCFFDTSSPKTTLVTRGKEFAEKLSDKVWMQQWIRTLLIDAVPAQKLVLGKVIADLRPSLIVSDPMVYAAVLLAREENIPWVGVSSSLNPITPENWTCDLTECLDLYAELRESLFEGISPKVQFKVSDAISPWLNIVFSTEDYVPRKLSGNNFSFYVGSSYTTVPRGDETEFPFHLLKKNCRKIYMSLGSQVYYYPELFLLVQEVFKNEDVQLIFSINELMQTDFVDLLTEQVLAVSYTPQLQLLPQVDLMISHGGANSVMECLAHGIPIALLPLCNDQFLQARFVELQKVGKVLNAQNPDLKHYSQALLPMLSDESPERMNARRIGQSFQKHQGAAEAADLIEFLFSNRQPMLPEIIEQ